MYSSITIANYFLRKGWAENIYLTPMQVLKLVYIAHGWYLGEQDEPLIRDKIWAWPYGPVIPELYFQINHYRGDPIMTPVTSAFRSVNEQTLDESAKEFLDTIWEHYKAFTPYELSALTHQKGTPWHQATRNHPRKDLSSRSIPIPNAIIQEYYKKKIRAVEEYDDE